MKKSKSHKSIERYTDMEIPLCFVKEVCEAKGIYENCDEDEPIEDIIRVVKDLYFCGYNIIFCTGRRESVRNKTMEWIKKHLNFNPCSYRLLMRKDNDWRHDTIVKPLMLDVPANKYCLFWRIEIQW